MSRRNRPNPRDFDRALLDAVVMDEPQAVQQLLQRGADVNTRDREHQETPLMLSQSEEVTAILLEHGADVLAQDDQGRTAFMRSINPILLRPGMDINAQDCNGKTSLMTAVEFHLDEAVPWLLAQGADISIVNQWGETALDIADNYSFADISHLLRQGLTESPAR